MFSSCKSIDSRDSGSPDLWGNLSLTPLILGITRSRGSVRSGRSLASENRQLSFESTLKGGPRFAAGDIGGEVRIFRQYPRSFQPAQHPDHHQVTSAEFTVQPVGIAKTIGK